MITAQAAFRNGVQVVTCYSNLGEDALIYSIKQTKMKVLVCNAKNVDLVLKHSKELDLELIVYIDEYKGKIDENNKLKIIQFEELEKIGEKAKKHELTRPTKDDIAVIMYTSGTKKFYFRFNW
jgi:long-chain acyl-CoA synthetase